MLSQSCDSLKGVGPAIATKLGKCGIHTIQDLLFHLPFRYQDRTRITAIRDLRAHDWAVVVGKICKTEIQSGKRPSLTCYIEDTTAVLKLRFFHYKQQQIKQLVTGNMLHLFGETRVFANQLEMIHPEYHLLERDQPHHVEETLTPIYAATAGLSQTRLRQIIQQAIAAAAQTLEQLEWLSQQQLTEFALYPLKEAILQIHRPPPDISIEALLSGNHPALRRLCFDELLAHQLSMQFAKQDRARLHAPPIPMEHALLDQFLQQLPFSLTTAQQKVLHDIQTDLNQASPMLRLVQGDVGSGKTVVSAIAALQVISQGHQVALMAPTELLSAQHYHTISAWLAPFAIQVQRLTGNLKSKEKKAILQALQQHECHLIIGTHALFQEEVLFKRLGLIIIDEQHRFGVEQRLALQQKGQQIDHFPHQLLMTATPIPRTLAMTQLAHMELSTIDELPPGRSPVITTILNQAKYQQIVVRLQAAIQQGRQAYWVCTLIEDSEKLQCMAAVQRTQALQELLPNLNIGLLHGRLSAGDKANTMLAFKQGAIHVLVATTVIEVGVDIPNASLMIIENAERLGLSQLHQLRGRVGRGCTQSHCILLYQAPLSAQSEARLRTMRATHDGFVVAEKDLELRGLGEILGTKQTGFRQFKIANLPRDQAFIPIVQDIAAQLVRLDKPLAKLVTKRWLGEYENFLSS